MSFKRKFGAAADMKELEYIVALHQTCMPETRENATVSSIDVMRLLKSRYRLTISHEQARDLVSGLGGGDNVEQEKEKKKKRHFFRKDTSSIGEDTPKEEVSSEKLEGTTDSTEHVDVKMQNVQVEDSDGELDPSVVEENEDVIAPESKEEDCGELPENYLDMVQILSVLYIPTTAAWAHEFWHPSVPPEPARELTGWPIKVFFLGLLRKLGKLVISRFSLFHPLRSRPLIQDVRDILSRGFPTETVVDETFVENLLLKHGEFERARNPGLIREMVEAARSPSGTFDDEAFVNALSSDLEQWDVDGDERLSTFFYDVFGTENPAEVERLEVEEPPESGIDEEANDPSQKGRRRGNLCKSRWRPFKPEHCNVDMVVDSHVSSVNIVAIWAFFIFSVALCSSLILATPVVESACDPDLIWCELSATIYSWMMIGVILSVFGVVMIVPLSYGNNPQRKSFCRELTAVIFAVTYACVPYAAIETFKREVSDDDTTSGRELRTPEEIVELEFWDSYQNITLAVGLSLAVLFCLQIIISLCHRHFDVSQISEKSHSVIHHLTSTSNVRAETRLKLAAIRKVAAMFLNAQGLHQLTQEDIMATGSDHRSTEQTLRNFVLRGERTELSGGFVWTWRMLLNGRLFHTEGIWLNTRLLTLQAAQFLVGGLVSLILLVSVERIATESEEARMELDPDLPQWVFDLVPTRQMVYWALYPATFVAILDMVLLFLLYIPSAVSTILKYRCQVIPSLGSPYFNVHRLAADTAYMNTANAIYGMIGSAALFWLLIGSVLFLFQWPFSQSFMLHLTVWGAGLGVTCGLKFLLTLTCRSAQYRAFYRIRPSGASISSLALECWYLGLGGSVLIGRITQFLCAAAFWIGRIDVNFLSEDVVLFGYAFDYVPSNFVKDLLVHEAHRHPYLERLAQVYLMKLRYKRFCSPAGAAWRQLAILAMFPWVGKYRVFNEARLQEALMSLEKRRLADNEDRGVVAIGAGATQDVLGGAVHGVLGGAALATEDVFGGAVHGVLGGAALATGGAATGFAAAAAAFKRDSTAASVYTSNPEKLGRMGSGGTSLGYMSATEKLERMGSETSLGYMSANEDESG